MICSQCSRSLPEEPGTDLTSDGARRFAVAHVGERGRLCVIGQSDLSIDVVDYTRSRFRHGKWLDTLDLGPDLAVVEDPRSWARELADSRPPWSDDRD